AATSSTTAHGLATTYSYWGTYLDQIVRPDGVTIQLLREARSATDMITYANGVALSNTQYRLKAAVVRVGGSLARAFGLTYGATEKTSMSRLATVREYGRDAVINADGTITGSSLLRFSASYTPELGDAFVAKPDVAWCANNTLVMMNHDGDSRADMHCRVGPT